MRLIILLSCFVFMLSCSTGTNTGAAANLEGYDTEVVKGTNVTKATKLNTNGEIIEQGFVSGGKRNGVWLTYYEGENAGKIKTLASYSDGILSGPYLEFSNRGQIETEVNYENNMYNGRYATYKFGRMTKEIQYKDNQLHGLSVEYDNRSNVQKEVNYKDGKQHGLMRFYNEDGDIVMEYEYENGKKIRGGLVDKEEGE